MIGVTDIAECWYAHAIATAIDTFDIQYSLS
jgi:hypothetical protein